jgi:hypothetical protein
VLISVEGVTPDLHALHVRSTLNGVSAKNEQDIVNNLSAFVAYLPPGSRGTATFEVSGVTTNLCQTATGTIAGVLPEEAPYRLDLTVRLAPTATTTCPLTVDVTGQGTVTSEPPGITCDQAGACRISVLQGSRVTLSAAPGPRSYDFAWGAPCAGAATCSVTVNQETRVPLTFGGRGCTDDWCWYNGLPQGNTLRAMWGASPTDLWIVGAYGTLLHYDGRSYSASPQSGVLTRNDLYGIWGPAANDVWALGDAGTLLHYKEISVGITAAIIPLAV